MARFIQSKDLAFFEKISKELVEDVVSTAIQFFKLSISESRTNLYGESLNKSYHQWSYNKLYHRKRRYYHQL